MVSCVSTYTLKVFNCKFLSTLTHSEIICNIKVCMYVCNYNSLAMRYLSASTQEQVHLMYLLKYTLHMLLGKLVFTWPCQLVGQSLQHTRVQGSRGQYNSLVKDVESSNALFYPC